MLYVSPKLSKVITVCISRLFSSFLLDEQTHHGSCLIAAIQFAKLAWGEFDEDTDMRAFTILLIAMALASVPQRTYAESVNDPGAGFLSYKHKKETKDFFVVRAGEGDRCSVVQGQFSDKPAGAIGGAPYASKDYAEAALKKLPECKGGEASESEGKKHGKK
jgi:hypothetical protein